MRKLVLPAIAFLIVLGVGNLRSFERREPSVPAVTETPSDNRSARNFSGSRINPPQRPIEEIELSLIDYEEAVNSLSGHSRRELIERFNPEPVNSDRFLEAAIKGHPLDRAENAFDLRWKSFVDSLSLTDQEKNRLKEVLIAHDAHNLELSNLAMTSQIDAEEHRTHRRSLEQLAASLETMLSEDQMTLFRDANKQRSDRFRRTLAEQNARNLANGVVGNLDAANRGDAATVMAYINSGADINAMTVDGKSPLHYAITHGNVEIARMLLEAGADPNLPTANERRATPLESAASNGDIEIIRALVAAGADPNLVSNSPGLSPLPSAALTGETEAVAVLLELGADATGEAGSRALTRAVRYGNPVMEQLLIDAGAEDDILTAVAREFKEIGRRLGVVHD